jgi:hypothetical protein
MYTVSQNVTRIEHFWFTLRPSQYVDCIASNERKSDEWRNGEDLEGSGHGLISILVLPEHVPALIEETHKRSQSL